MKMETAYKYGYLLATVEAVLKANEHNINNPAYSVEYDVMPANFRSILEDALIYLEEDEHGQDVKR